ncbi:tyrosine-type recombinase/integrase [Rhizobium sp. AG855]|uniref:tyrosine-type recombinase/integrase n=1 Tax=Rhizobium sp. AG855 TaxID=2183898 RepID=UPI000E71CCBB|nr:tyrosine-type recombinase/integrase [Rhizobium sp. AG855]RKE84903.1 site-specific recombinase XerD [Rhizobium sp. AG855]
MIRHKLPKYVQMHKDPRDDKKWRIYYRRAGKPKIALRGPIYSEDFWSDYRKAEAGEEVQTGAGASKTIPGTVNSLIVKYYASADFLELAAATQRNYKSVLEPFRTQYGNNPLAGLRREHINAILNKRALSSTAQAKNLSKRLSTLFKFGLDFGLIKENPMIGVKRVKHEETHYEMWTDAEIAAYRKKWPEGTPQRVALEILVYTGLRRSDAVRLGPQHVKDGLITITAQKTGVELHIPVHPKLRPFLSIRRDVKLINLTTYISTVHGKPRSEKAFTNYVKEAATEAGLPASRSPHGLRRAACRALAEAGCTVWEIMSITGHQSSKEVEGYVADVDKKKLAKSAMAKWEATS